MQDPPCSRAARKGPATSEWRSEAQRPARLAGPSGGPPPPLPNKPPPCWAPNEPRRVASVSRAGAWKFNRKSARTPLPPRLGAAFASVDPGRGDDGSAPRAEVDGALPALWPGLAPPRPESALRPPPLRPPLPPPPPRAPLPPPRPRLGSGPTRLPGPLSALGVGTDAARAGGGANGAASRFSPPTPRAASSAMAMPRESTRARPPTRLTLMSRRQTTRVKRNAESRHSSCRRRADARSHTRVTYV